MSFTLIIDPAATLQAREAYEYYEKAKPGLGDRFMELLSGEINYIQQHPRHYQKLKGNIRQALIPKFPYVIIYEQFDNYIAVYSIFHTSRNPKKKPDKG